MQSPTGIDAFKRELTEAGFTQRAVISDQEMRRAQERLDQTGRALETPPEELRYIEGLLQLPLGHLRFFKVIPGSPAQCRCGRVMTALDIVAHALVREIHSRELVRATLTRTDNLFEIARDGRAAECYACGRPIVAASYFTHRYAYA